MQGQPQPDRPHSAEPSRLGKYEILERIGEGGFGIVYKGFDPLIQRFVALKTCTSPDQELRQRYTREAQIAGQLDHPNIVRIFDFGIEDATPYLVQEFLSGEDLDDKIQQRAFVPQPERLLYLIHIARGLRYAHSKGVVHRDIKPANIRIQDDGTAKIMDFGVATLQHSDTRLTAAGTTMGTAAYLAPEQIRGEEVDARTDIFSFGVLAYELVTGERPFAQETISAILYEILNDDPRPITVPTSVCPEGLRKLILRCLEKDPDRRYTDCGEIVSALETVRETLKSDPRPRDLTAALRKTAPPPRSAPAPDGPALASSSPQPARQRQDFDPVIRHEWTPRGVAIAKRRFAIKPILIFAVALLAAIAAYSYLGTQGLAPWPEDLLRSMNPMPASVSDPETEAGDLFDGPEARVEDSQPTATVGLRDDSTPGAAAEEPSHSLPAVTPGPQESEVADAEADPLSQDLQEAVETDLEPAPVIEDPTLTVAASWHPEMTVTIDSGRPLTLARGRSLQLEPGAHQVVFALTTRDYSARRSQRVELSPGEQRTLRSPIQRPGLLTVQASLGSPQGLIAVDGEPLGSSPLRGKKIAPGSYRLDLYPLEGSTAPMATTQLEIRVTEETVVTFDLSGRQELSVRSRQASP